MDEIDLTEWEVIPTYMEDILVIHAGPCNFSKIVDTRTASLEDLFDIAKTHMKEAKEVHGQG
jgi:hypothetical protein